jgi:uncharacterized protein involved in response to NO
MHRVLEAGAPADPGRIALFDLGFRPFYLLAGAYAAAVMLSAALWSAAFALFTAAFIPILARPRLDGQPG